MDQSTPGFPVLLYFPEFIQTHVIWVVMSSKHLTLCWPLLLLPSIFLSIRIFFNVLVVHTRWPKYWIFSFSISSPNEYSGLISFRIDWSYLLAIKRLSKSSPAPQFESINSLVLSLLLGPLLTSVRSSLVAQMVKRLPTMPTCGKPGSIPGSGSSPGEGNGSPLQYSCLENPMDGGTW